MSYEDTLFVTHDHGDYWAREGTIETIYDQLSSCARAQVGTLQQRTRF